MNELLKETLVSCQEVLSESDYEIAERYIREAFAQGWTSIGFWSYDEPATLTDLYGVNPYTRMLLEINYTTLAYRPSEEDLKQIEELSLDAKEELALIKQAKKHKKPRMAEAKPINGVL